MRQGVLICLVVLFAACGGQGNLALFAERLTAVANQVDAVTVIATATTPSGVPMPNLPINFTASQGTLSSAQATTDQKGVAQVTLTAGLAGMVTVTASSASTSSASAFITFTAPGPRLRFQTSPGNTATSNLLRPVPVVVIEDDQGVVATSSAAITVGITPGSCSAVLEVSSLSTVNASQGSASFFGLKSATPAQRCTLTATSGTFEKAVSAAFDIL